MRRGFGRWAHVKFGRRRAHALLAGLFAAASCAGVAVWPDYLDVTVPPNVAPLNFAVVGEGAKEVVMAAGGDTLAARIDAEGVAVWPADGWRRFLAAHAGGAARVTVRCGGETLCATNRIAAEPMDTHLTYRLIPPSYTFYREMGVWQRDLTSFDERPVFRNVQTRRKQCVNCHTFNRADTGEYLFHTRAFGAGTQIVSRKWGMRKVDLDVPGAFGAGVYPAWHPGGDFIAFSVNETRQNFYADGADKIEVADLRSDLVLYSFADDTVTFIEDSNEIFETFPTWSPDGRDLYSVRARTDLTTMPTNAADRADQLYRQSSRIFYDLVVRRFDPATRAFGEPRMLIDAKASGRSVTFPRVSPDGRWLVMAIGPYGSFHVWHRETDLWILDLRKSELRPLAELNSAEAESYHTFSSDGAWMVFSSRQIDGGYTRPFFAHFDAARGVFDKPFLLPMARPRDHVERMFSYNVPEFAKGPVAQSPRELRRLVERSPVKARRGAESNR